jgi:hypothetical protein
MLRLAQMRLRKFPILLGMAPYYKEVAGLNLAGSGHVRVNYKLEIRSRTCPQAATREDHV